MWARIHLIPLLQAEEDRDQVRRYWADQKREKELLGDNTKVYNSDRCDFPLTMDWVESNGLLTVKQIRATDICCFPGTFEINGVDISMGRRRKCVRMELESCIYMFVDLFGQMASTKMG